MVLTLYLRTAPDLPHGPHGPGPMGLHKKKGLHNETKDEKNLCYRKWKLLLFHLITCHNIFWPNRYTYFSQARIQRGGPGGLRPSREKSAYTTGVYFGRVFRQNTPNFCGSLRSPERVGFSWVGVINPSRTKNLLIRAWLLCNLLPRSIITINAHIHYCTFYVTWAASGLHINCAQG